MRHRARDRGAPALLGIIISKVSGAQIAVGRESDVVVLDFIEPKLRQLRAEIRIRLPKLLIKGVDPRRPVHVVPQSTGHFVAHCQIGATGRDHWVFEHHHPRDGVDAVGI